MLKTWHIVDVRSGKLITDCYGNAADAAARVRRYLLDTGRQARAVVVS